MTLFKKYLSTLTATVLGVILFGPAVFDLILTTPSLTALRTGRFQIVSIQQDSPHLRLKDESGRIVSANFPYDLAHRSPRQYLVRPEKFKSFSKCDATIGYEVLSMFTHDVIRVWSVDCPSGEKVSYAHAVKYFERMNVEGSALVRFALGVFVIGFCYFFDRRRGLSGGQ